MPNGDVKRDAILNAATEVFANYGFKKTTVGDIIRAAGVSRATVYKHFSDKEEVFDAVIRREILEMLAEDRRALAGETTTRGRLRAVIVTHSDLIRRKINLLRFTKERFADIVPHTEGPVRELMVEAMSLFTDILHQGVNEGEIAVDDVDATASAMLYAMKGVFMTAVIGVWDGDRDAVIDRMLDLFMDGLRPRGEAAA